MKNLIKLTLIILASNYLTACGMETVETGHRGIVVSFGEVLGEPLPEGLHFFNPITKSVKEYKVQTEKWESKTAIFTKDTQRVDVEFAITFYPDPQAVAQLFREYGPDYVLAEKVIQPVALGSIKDAIGQVIADELVSKREHVTKTALQEVTENLKAKNVIVTDLQFTNLDFDDAYEQAVEQKVVAVQEAQKAKNETVKIEEEARQTVLSAKAQAESMRIQSEALSKNKGLVEYELAKKWDGKLPQYMFGSTTPLLDLKSIKQ